MTRWGCGPKIVKRTLLAAIIVYALHYFLFPAFRIPISQSLATVIGIIWFVAGISVWFLGAKEIKKHFSQGELITSGIFKFVQHPIYSAFILFYIPALVLISRSVIGFVLPFVFYFFFRRYIHIEETYLANKFGQEYVEYRGRTGSIFPKFIL